jgi:hypothetical protein
MTLFTKMGCIKCDLIKYEFQLQQLGIQVEELSPENPAALAHLAWHELVETAKKELPILVLDDMSCICGVIPVRSYLLKRRAPITPVPHTQECTSLCTL